MMFTSWVEQGVAGAAICGEHPNYTNYQFLKNFNCWVLKLGNFILRR